MKDFFKRYLSGEDWLIKEEDWNPRWQNVREAQFTLGNGYLGSRGVLEEIPAGAYPGTYLAGIFDKSGAAVNELVNLPNPVDFKIIVQGEKLGMGTMEAREYKRVLDMKKGLLVRRTLYENSHKNKFDYRSLRFFSMDNPCIGAFRVYFTPLDEPCEIFLQAAVDTSITNHGPGGKTKKKHFRILEVARGRNIFYLSVETLESKLSVGYGSCLSIFYGKNGFFSTENSLRLKIKKNQTVCFTKIFSIVSSSRVGSKRIKGHTLKELKRSVTRGFKGLLDRHIKTWGKKWQDADIVVEPGRELTRALRFNIYHLLIAGNEFDSKVSIGARTLSGEGYRGHIFWDAEIFVLPFFIYTNPSVARNILYYRYFRLGAARKNAERQGFRGALFPWESADKGGEVTPSWHKGLDGRLARIYTGQMEQHIVGDIAYALSHYYRATADERFMLKAGLEIIFETARFWASRVNYSNGYYEIKGVIGPDEFRTGVDNNAYTNSLARWNLLEAHRLYNGMKKAHPVRLKILTGKIKLTEKEAETWRKIAPKIIIPRSPKNDLIEAFKGYFKKKDVPVKELDNNFMPVLPRGLSMKDVKKTQLIKQPDTVMLFHLFPRSYSQKTIRDNFFYYDKRTLHESSLSPSISAIVALKAGDFVRASHYFYYALKSDLENFHGNTADGIHAASLGGTWQAVINGFCGMELKEDELAFSPQLPLGVKAVKFRIKYRDFKLRISVHKKSVRVLVVTTGKKKARLRGYGQARELKAGRNFIFRSPAGGGGRK